MEQFCINFTNERLHLQFNHHMFKAEQEEYEKENVPWEKITFQDNSGCIDLIEKPGGILAALDEECRLPKGNDDAFLNKITQKHKSNVWFGINPRMPSVFAIKHFAGTVNYTVTSFLTKNKNTLNADVTRAMATSTTVLIAMHYAKDDSEDSKKNFAKRTPVRRETTNANKTTVTQKFRKELADLLKLLEESQRHYIRCIKPNELKVEKNFQPSKVLAQLKSNGVMETVRLRKAGYTLKTPPETFYLRYVFLGIESVSKVPNFLQKYTTQDLWAMGKTKVFLRAALIEKLEDDRQNKLRDKVTSIQRFIRRYNQMAQYRLLLDSWKRKKEEEERKRLEEENRKRLLEEERLRKIEEERKRKEEEELRKQQELERKKQAEEEAKRKQLETLQKQQAEREKKIEEQQLEKDRLEKQRKEEELFRREFPTQKSRERILLAQKNQNSFTSDKISDLPKSPSRIQVMEKKQLFELARKPPSPAQPKTPNPVVPQFTRSPTISPVAIGQRQNHFSALKSIWERKPPPGVSVPNTTPPSSPSIPSLSLSSPRPDLMDEKPDTPRPFSPRDKKLGFGSMSHQPEIGSRRLFPRKMDLDVSFEEEKNEGRVRRDEERRKQEEQRLRAEEEKRQKEEQLRKMEEEERLLKEEKERLRLEEINLRMEEERILKEVELFRKQEEEREAARIAERNRRLEEERLRKLKEEQEMKRKEEERMRQVEEDRMKRGAEWKRLNSPKDATARVEPVTKQQPPPKKQENPVAKAKEDQKIMQDLQNWQVQADKANEELNKSDEFRNMFNSIDFDFSDTSEFNDNVRKRLSDWSMLSNAIKPKSEPVEEPNFDEEINYPTTYKRPTKESDELKDMVNEIQRISQSYSKKRTISKNSNPLAKYTSDEFKKSPTPISRVQDTLTSNNNSPLRYEQPNNDRTWPSTRRVRDDNNQAPLPFYMHGVQKGSTRQSTRQVGRLPRFSGRVSQSFNTESEESEESSEVDPVDELRLNATELENMMANFSSTRSGSTTTSESEEENEPLPTIRSRFTPNKTHLRSLVESQSKFKSPARTFQNTEFPPQVEQASNPPQIAQPPTLPQIDPNIPDTGKGTIRNEYIDSLLESATQEDLDSMLSLLENYETEPVETDYNKFDEDPFNPEPADVSSFRRDPNDFTNEVVPQETGVSDEQLYNNFSPEEINEAFAELGLDDFDNWDNENDDIQHKVTSTMHYSDEDFYKHASAILADINSKNPQ
uniref:Myosin motor domain-containing protein n=1 Tax=Arcella intermedia TaxID=1963864 RepID=A0A6B2KWU6_9EUKA